MLTKGTQVTIIGLNKTVIGRVEKDHTNGYISVSYKNHYFGAHVPIVDTKWTTDRFTTMVNHTVFADIKL